MSVQSSLHNPKMFMQETQLGTDCENNVDCNAEYDTQDSDEDL